MALRLVPPPLTPEETGRRFRHLRKLSGLAQGVLAEPLSYAAEQASNISKIEAKGKPMNDARKVAAANFLAGKGDLCNDAHELLMYLRGEHDSLDRCLSEPGGDDGGISDAGEDLPKGGYPSAVAGLKRVS